MQTCDINAVGLAVKVGQWEPGQDFQNDHREPCTGENCKKKEIKTFS